LPSKYRTKYVRDVWTGEYINR